jgi:hypothetical protein
MPATLPPIIMPTKPIARIGAKVLRATAHSRAIAGSDRAVECGAVEHDGERGQQHQTPLIPAPSPFVEQAPDVYRVLLTCHPVKSGSE